MAALRPEEVERIRAQLAAEHDTLFSGIRATRADRQQARERGWATRRAERMKHDPIMPHRSALLRRRG